MEAQPTIYDATASCRKALVECQGFELLMKNEWAENRLADFNLWASGIGASVRNRTSLDSRLGLRPDARDIVTNLLQLLQAEAEGCMKLATSEEESEATVEDRGRTLTDNPSSPCSTRQRSLSPWSDASMYEATSEDSTSEVESDAALLKAMSIVDSILDQLARIAIVIRRSGTRSRLQKADGLFKPEDHGNLFTHLMTIVLSQRPSTVFPLQELDQSELSSVQLRLINCNLRRRNRFLHAQKHSKALEAKPAIRISATVQESGNSSQRESKVNMPSISKPAATKPIEQAATPSAKTGTSATGVTDLEPLPQNSVPLQAAATQLSATVKKLGYPRPPVIKPDARLFRKHLAEDLCPYTCVIPDCPRENVLYVTKEAWTTHLLEGHGSVEFWVCFACSETVQFDQEYAFVGHVSVVHKDTISAESIPTLTSACKRTVPAELGPCPLCISGTAEHVRVDRTALMDHIAEHVHEFSLRSLPWGADDCCHANKEQIEHSTVKVTDWLAEYEISAATEDIPPLVEPEKPSDPHYFELNEYFAESAIGSDGAETDSDGTIKRELEELREEGPLLVTMPLTQLYPDQDTAGPGTTVKVDIIAVHGLNYYESKSDADHAWDTWRKPAGRGGRLWLRDDLPQDVLGSRIFLYQYDSIAAFCGDRSTFIAKANELLQAIKTGREGWESRPMLLIGHSVGGLLIEQALFNALSDPRYSSNMGATTGLAFFATPQLGLGGHASLGSLMAEIAVTEGLSRCEAVLGTLRNENIFSDIIQEHWRRRLSLRFDIVYFLEDPDSDGSIWSKRFPEYMVGEKVVMAGKKVVLRDADHGTICKFGPSRIDSDNLELVRHNIRSLYKRAMGREDGRVDKRPREDIDSESGEQVSSNIFEAKDYTIGWISVMGIELAAAQAILDEEHPVPERIDRTNENNYRFGRIGAHNVVMTTAADGVLGSFPNIRVCLMVGIGGGVPSERHDIRLGDVVIGVPTDRHGTRSYGGVVCFDYGKSVQEKGLHGGHFLTNKPPEAVFTAIDRLKTKYGTKENQINKTINEMYREWPKMQRRYNRPDPSTDKLYASDATLIQREERSEWDDDPAVHYGLIASSDGWIASTGIRDMLAKELDVLCFKMQGSGLMSDFPCLIVRGVCDYSDSHWSEYRQWQGYAALTASVYARDLIREVIPEQLMGVMKNGEQLLHPGSFHYPRALGPCPCTSIPQSVMVESCGL
ncbi:hypothetical protein XA68_17162 [Ophiocordyceps unilateralis]|uniref:C2H2-type domain-containing protein n=1 Tax=Ophiocordyceps unilateralis TaxID=268505 RepID=A0A2A9PJ40_OPHUN|nr:hypothetical protein XA68_17162 [Ophiocordyceps unilateralis]